MHKTAAAVLEDDEEQDEYDDAHDERPTLDPVERPSDERGERPTRPSGTRMATRRWKSR